MSARLRWALRVSIGVWLGKYGSGTPYCPLYASVFGLLSQRFCSTCINSVSLHILTFKLGLFVLIFSLSFVFDIDPFHVHTCSATLKLGTNVTYIP